MPVCSFSKVPVCLTVSRLSAALRYAVHDTLMITAFSGVFLLKMVNLFPDELDVKELTAEVVRLAELLSYIAAERYVLTHPPMNKVDPF